MYEALMPQFRDTPRPDRDLLQYLGHWLEGIGRRVARDARKIVRENWDTETLREGGITSAENESSVVLLGDLGSGGILLTADAGLKALGTAIDYARARGIDPSTLWLFQVPHHGSRNNISPSMLNRIVGRQQQRTRIRLSCAGGACWMFPWRLIVAPDLALHAAAAATLLGAAPSR